MLALCEDFPFLQLPPSEFVFHERSSGSWLRCPSDVGPTGWVASVRHRTKLLDKHMLRLEMLKPTHEPYTPKP